MELRLARRPDQHATQRVMRNAFGRWCFEAGGVGEHGGEAGFEDGRGFDILDLGAEGGLVEEREGCHVGEVGVDAGGVVVLSLYFYWPGG